MRILSRRFSDFAHDLVETIPRGPERTVALRKLLEADDAAVRAVAIPEIPDPPLPRTKARSEPDTIRGNRSMISISKVAVPVSAKPGAVIGALTAFDAKGNLVTGVRFQTEAASLFAVDTHGNLTAAVIPVAGFYAVHLYAVVGEEVIDEADVVISVS